MSPDGESSLDSPLGLPKGQASRWLMGLWGGTLGSLLPALAMGVRYAWGGPVPMFMRVYRNVFSGASSGEALIFGGVLFLLSGAVWGLLFILTIPEASIFRGALFGIAPAFWLFLVVAPVLLDQPIFFGFAAPKVIPPVLFNCVLWGSFVGWFIRRRAHRP